MYNSASMKKEVREKIKKYIFECINTDYLQECGYSVNNQKEIIKSIYDCMCSEWYNNFNRRQYPHRHEALKQYLKGLPSSFSIDYYYDAQRKIVAEWLSQSQEESETFTDEQVETKFYHLIAREFYSMLD